MKRKESMAVYHPSRFLQVMLQILVIFALFGIGFSEVESQENKEATSADPNSAMSTTMPRPSISILIDQKEYKNEYVSLDEESIKFDLYPPTNNDCVKDDKMEVSFELSIAGCEPLVIKWIKDEGFLKVSANYASDRKRTRNEFIEDKPQIFNMSIERKGNKKVIITDIERGETTTKCEEGINNPFELSYSAGRIDCGVEIKLLNAYVYTTTTSTTTPTTSTTTTSATTTPGSTMTSAATSSSAPTTNTQNTIIGLAPLTFGLIVGGILLLLILIVAGLLLYFLWWRKRKTDKEEKNEPPRPPGISPETMAKLLAMKPKVFPLTEKQKQIKAGAMAEEDDYPTEVSDDSGFGPVQSDPDSRKKTLESTQRSTHPSSKTDSKQRSSAKL